MYKHLTTGPLIPSKMLGLLHHPLMLFFETLDSKPKWIKIFSDNDGHYHNSELMTIVANWNQWYRIDICGWHFFEPGEAKSSVDSHHAQVSYSFI